jgi:hypothetical protein
MVMDNIFRGGCINLANGIERVLNSAAGKTTASFTQIGASLFTPVPRLNTAPLTDDFWESIKSGWPTLAEETR